MDKLDKMATNLDEFKSFGPPSNLKQAAESQFKNEYEPVNVVTKVHEESDVFAKHESNDKADTDDARPTYEEQNTA
jgi:hypothetical protein